VVAECVALLKVLAAELGAPETTLICVEVPLAA